MTKTLVATVLGVLVLAAPAFADAPPGQALYPETIPGAGLHGVAGATHTIRREAAGRGLIGNAAFRLSPAAVAYTRGALRFRSTEVRVVSFGLNTVTVRGTGLLNGHRVPFTALGIHNLRPEVDAFRLAWNHGAAVGGVVTRGSVFIR